MNYEENGRELIQKFRLNFQRLKEFMSSIDKEVASMAIFNTRDDTLATDYPINGSINDDNDGVNGNTSV